MKIAQTAVTVFDTIDEYYQYYDTFEVKRKVRHGNYDINPLQWGVYYTFETMDYNITCWW